MSPREAPAGERKARSVRAGHAPPSTLRRNEPFRSAAARQQRPCDLPGDQRRVASLVHDHRDRDRWHLLPVGNFGVEGVEVRNAAVQALPRQD